VSSAVGALTLGVLAESATPVEFGALIAAGFLAAGALAVGLPGVRAFRY